MRREVPLIAE